MKIKEFSITRYGPLPKGDRISLHNFNLFFGKNEDGKTLTIDALVKLLLGRNVKDFEQIDRVEENPEGYVIVADDSGNEFKLPEKGDLTKVADLTPSECRNIFIVRNSNLSIAREVVQESEFYTSVTDRLTGLRTKDISKIKERLKDLGKLTRADSSAKLSDDQAYGKIKSRIDNAKETIKKIDELQSEIQVKKFDKFELEATSKKEELEKIELRIKAFEDARKREKYEKGKKALDNLKEYLEKLKGLEIYNEKDEQLWRDCEKDIKTYRQEEERALADLHKNEEEFEKTSEKLSQIERDFRIREERKKKLDDEIRPELKTYETKRRELAQQEEKSKFLTLAEIILLILLAGISVAALIVSRSLFFCILAGLFVILLVIFLRYKWQVARNRAWLAEVFERNKLALSKFGMDAENIKGILENIQSFDEEYHKDANRIQDIKREKENLEGKIKELRDKIIPDKQRKIRDAEEKIEEIKMKSKEKSLKDYTSKLKLKHQFETSKGQEESVLKSHFEEKSKEENISYWEGQVRELEEYKDKAKAIKYSETSASGLENEKQRLKKELEKITEAMKAIHGKMGEVERRVNEILQLEGEYLHCKTSVDLEVVKDKLQEFINKNEGNKDNTLEVIRIFEEIEVEEKEKVSGLFGKASPISRYFNKITSGRYEEVNFNQKTGKIEVKLRDGKILGAEILSGGAYDQLYFSIRLALGNKLLKGRKGFFIMDDPFIKADPDRLQRQIEMLKNITELGWQVIYFSAKGEIKDAFKVDIEHRTINYVELQGIFS